MTPKIIHQTWKSTEIPPRWQRFRDAWKKFHPGWEFRLWTDEDNRRLVERDYTAFLQLYDSYAYPVQKADFARILYLHKFGGVYADLDLEPLRPLDGIIDQPHLILGEEKEGMGKSLNRRDFIINAFMASPKGHPFWKMLLERLRVTFRHKRLLQSKGHYIIQTVIFELDKLARDYQQTHQDITIYPYEVFYPLSWHEACSELERSKAVEMSYTIHHFDTTWFSGGMMLMKKLRRRLNI